MRTIEKTIVLEDYYYVEGQILLKVSGNKLYENSNQIDFDIDDILDVEFAAHKKYSPPKIPASIKSNRISALSLPKRIKTSLPFNSETYYEIEFDEIICDDKHLNGDGQIIAERFNSVKEGSRIFSTIVLKAFGLKKIKRYDKELITVYDITKTTKGSGEVSLEPDKDYYLKGEKVRIKAIPEKGHKFLGWGGSHSNNSEDSVELEIDEDVHFDAFFTDPEKKRRKRLNQPSLEQAGCISSIRDFFGWLILVFFIGVVMVSLIGALGWGTLLFILFLFVAWSLPSILGYIFRWRIIKNILGVFLWLILLGGLYELINNSIIKDPANSAAEKIPETEEKQLENRSVLYSHQITWEDYEGQQYSTTLKINSDDILHETKIKEDIPVITSQDDYSLLLRKISAESEESLIHVYKALDSIKQSNSLDQKAFASVIVSMVQHIPYFVILPKGCSPYEYIEPAIREAIRDSPCQGNVTHGIKTPAEFLKDLKGDCDSRTLLLYTILKHYDYEVGIFGSERYHHSLLGIANYVSTGSYRTIYNTEYYLWETTNTGFPPGEIPLEIQNMSFWEPNIY